MYTETNLLKEDIVKKVVTGKIKYEQAARQLRVTSRTVQNYCYRFLKDGPQRLKDRRTEAVALSSGPIRSGTLLG